MTSGWRAGRRCIRRISGSTCFTAPSLLHAMCRQHRPFLPATLPAVTTLKAPGNCLPPRWRFGARGAPATLPHYLTCLLLQHCANRSIAPRRDSYYPWLRRCRWGSVRRHSTGVRRTFWPYLSKLWTSDGGRHYLHCTCITFNAPLCGWQWLTSFLYITRLAPVPV